MKRLELDIDRLSNSGEGLARLDGRAVFVPGALPGERVLAGVADERTQRGELLEILVPSPERRTPPCPLAERCGGCDWMHLEEAAQGREKQRLVVSSLAHVGGLPEQAYEQRALVASPHALGYRRRAVLHPTATGLGFFGRRSHELVPVERCLALTEPLADLPGRLAEALRPVLKTLASVQLLECGGRVALSAHLRAEPRPRHRECLASLVASRVVVGAVLVPAQGKGATERWGTPELEADGVWHRPDGFAQANAAVNQRLVAEAIELLDLAGAPSLLELYAGNGNFTFAAAQRARSVLAVEVAGLGVELGQRAARERRVEHLRWIQGDCARVADGLVREGRRFDRLLLDPPRTGAPGVGRWAAKLGVSRVVYVACDPVALARDAAELSREGFAARTLRTFDLFPQTRHVEAVMAFDRRGAVPSATRNG